MDEYTAACNPYRPGDARALCAGLGVTHQVAAVADILAAWCWSVSRYEHTTADMFALGVTQTPNRVVRSGV